MKKEYSHKVLALVTCCVPGCGKRLKRRLVESKQRHNITKCWKHYNERRGGVMNHRAALGFAPVKKRQVVVNR